MPISDTSEAVQDIAFCNSRVKALTFSYRHHSLPFLSLETFADIHRIVLWSHKYSSRPPIPRQMPNRHLRISWQLSSGVRFCSRERLRPAISLLISALLFTGKIPSWSQRCSARALFKEFCSCHKGSAEQVSQTLFAN